MCATKRKAICDVGKDWTETLLAPRKFLCVATSFVSDQMNSGDIRKVDPVTITFYMFYC